MTRVGAVQVPAHLDTAWWVVAYPIWDALDEDDFAYRIALKVVLALDEAGLLAPAAAAGHTRRGTAGE